MFTNYKPLTFTDEELAEFTKASVVASGYKSNSSSNYGWYDTGDFVNWDAEEDIPPAVPKCFHDWKADSWFSARVYHTCSKCGAKKEDE